MSEALPFWGFNLMTPFPLDLSESTVRQIVVGFPAFPNKLVGPQTILRCGRTAFFATQRASSGQLSSSCLDLN